MSETKLEALLARTEEWLRGDGAVREREIPGGSSVAAVEPKGGAGELGEEWNGEPGTERAEGLTDATGEGELREAASEADRRDNVSAASFDAEAA